MLVELVPIASLALDPENEREHPAENIKDIKNSLKLFGQQTPLTINENSVVLKGNGTLIAARELGWTEIAVHHTGLTEKKQKAYKIADNRSGEKAKWNKDLLSKSLENLKGDFSLDELGFDDSWIKVTPVEGGIPDDEIPEQVETRCKPGDLWQMGAHRLKCGDSTDVLAIEQLMNGEKAAVWLSDPPYGINHVEVSQEKGQSKGYKKIANDDLKDDEFKDFIFSVITASLPFMKKGFAFYMWHAMKMQGYTAAAAAAAGILFHRQIIWVKPQFVFGRGHYHWKHELCLMGWLQGNEPPFYGEKNQTSVWEVARENDKIHPTQKPVKLLEPSILNHAMPNEIIYEPFSGSGSTFIAAEKTGRRCFGLELESTYCDKILARWEQFSGKKAVLSTGTPTE
jgi:DNA modification methylase